MKFATGRLPYLNCCYTVIAV